MDDSVIFTNDVKEDQFGEQLDDINAEIEKLEKEPLDEADTDLQPQAVLDMRKSGFYGIRVHSLDENGGVSKSSFTRLDQLDESEIYLKCISREASQAGNEIFKIYSDEEDIILEERMRVLSGEIQKKIAELDGKIESLNTELLERLENEQYMDTVRENQKQIQSLSKFRDRWIRYHRFFEYRKQRLNLRHICDANQSNTKELEEIIYGAQKYEAKDEKLRAFMRSYGENIWSAAVAMYCDYTDEDGKKRLGKYIAELNHLCFAEENKDSSYLYKVYEELIKIGKGEEKRYNCNKAYMESLDSYRTLKCYAARKLKSFSHKHYDVAEYRVKWIQEKDWKNKIFGWLLSNDMIEMAEIIYENTSQFLRMCANAVYSQLFDVEIEDKFVVRKFSRKPLSCGEFRILLFLRNPLFTEEAFLEQKILLNDPGNRADLDYAVMEVIDIFKSFVADPIRIDKLVLTHQYTYEIWKNGSKHLYFYTLHNQEHAIALIRNIVKLIHAISFLKISTLDFYVLFLACYLHDISMVKIPSLDAFLTDKEEGDTIAWEHLQEICQESPHDAQSEAEEKMQGTESAMEDIAQIKKWMTLSYRKLDAYYEKKIRERHAWDSAAEIRTRSDLNFLDQALREFVAEVSEAHQADARDIYFTKSSAAEKMISLKFDKILLRLADLLDMSNCRISRPILYHNLDQMSEESAFHWISHLLTQGYELKTEYNVVEKRECLTPKSIVEKLVLTVIVDMSQMSKCKCQTPCKYMEIDNIGNEGFELKVGKECDKGEKVCNFLCKWFSRKNQYLMEELFALEAYLNRVPENYFEEEVLVRIKIENRTCLDEKQFGILERYLR